jgi:hypothetical protein
MTPIDCQVEVEDDVPLCKWCGARCDCGENPCGGCSICVRDLIDAVDAILVLRGFVLPKEAR